MAFSRNKFKIGELVKLTDLFQQERKSDNDVQKCKIGLVLGCCRETELGYLYKIHWRPIGMIFYDEQSRLERI